MLPIDGPDLGKNNFRGEDRLYEPLAAMQAYQESTGMVSNPSAGFQGGLRLPQPGQQQFGQQREAGGFRMPTAPAPMPGQGQVPTQGKPFKYPTQRYQKGYQMPRRAGMLQFVSNQLRMK